MRCWFYSYTTYLLSVWVVFELLINTVTLQATDNFSSSNNGVRDTQPMKLSKDGDDPVDTAIGDIIDVFQNIVQMREDELSSAIFNRKPAQVLHRARRAAEQYQSDYQQYECGTSCMIRPVITIDELTRARLFLSDAAENKSIILDCPQDDEVPMDRSQIFPIKLTCETHYTGGLTHVVVKMDSSVKARYGPFEHALLARNFSQQLATISIEQNPFYREGYTKVYLTFEIPITQLGWEDLSGIQPWLGSLHLDGKYLHSIDEHMLGNMSLDYFALENCERGDVVLTGNDRPGATLPPGGKCAVEWKYSCPILKNFKLLADLRAQESECQKLTTIPPPPSTTTTSTTLLTTPPSSTSTILLTTPLSSTTTTLQTTPPSGTTTPSSTSTVQETTLTTVPMPTTPSTTTTSTAASTTTPIRLVQINTTASLPQSTTQRQSTTTIRSRRSSAVPESGSQATDLRHVTQLIEQLTLRLEADLGQVNSEMKSQIGWYQSALTIALVLSVLLLILLIACIAALAIIIRKCFLLNRQDVHTDR